VVRGSHPAYTELVLSKTDEMGDYLVEGSGLSLYVFSQDTVGTATTAPVSNCDDACLTAFPIFLSVVPSLLDPAAFTVFTRTDGRQQSAYHGHPLYLHVGDQAPGETNGRGLRDRFDTIDPARL